MRGTASYTGNPGGVTIALTGSAAFSNLNNYVCQVVDQTAATANAFAQAVEAARARGPEPKRPDMAPGTAPRPPRPGREPREPKEPVRPRRNY